MSLREYIEERSMPIPFVGCWVWLLSIGTHGYGQAYLPDKRVTTAHRVSFLAFKGEIPPGMLVQHSCDNKWCVNPNHLSLGTDKTNSDDKIRKGRGNWIGRKFPPHPTRRLTNELVATIRASSRTNVDLARRCGVDPNVIANIRSGKHYRDAYGAAQSLLPLLPHEQDEVDRLLREAAECDEEPDWAAYDAACEMTP